jgi:tetratricopeptide (TPR) repeat protein
MKRTPLVILTIAAVCMPGFPQEEGSEEQAEPPVARIEAVLPVENRNLLFIEGEEAVSTNFSKEAILNYSCSGFRTLQLSRTKGLQGGAPFYSDFVFYVQEPGIYELWYGGTPPGPKDELFPSYASPFRYSLDEAQPVPVFREDAVVVENYTPSYYWIIIDDVTLSRGEHTLRFEVTEKRRYDNRFYFYLDAFFLVRKEGNRRAPGELLPEVFPRNMDDRSIDFPFRAVEDYQILIRDDPDRIVNYTELSLVFTLLSDYFNALKYLKRAVSLEPGNLDLLLLQAKNEIWKGDVDAGLNTYRRLLEMDQQRLDLWAEAGKVAAWTRRYSESVSFYEDALAVFPEDQNLLVNLALTNLWSGETRVADDIVSRITRAARSEFSDLKELALIFSVNGYPERAIELYSELRSRFPNHREGHLLLEDAYRGVGKKDEAAEVRLIMESSFLPTEDLSSYLEISLRRQSLKEELIANYEKRLEDQPDDLELRELLAQTYFWNGRRERGIGEYQGILVNHIFRELRELDRRSFDLLQLLDKGHLLDLFYGDLPDRVAERRSELQSLLSEYGDALEDLESFQEKVEQAKDRGEEPPAPPEEDPQTSVDNASRALSEAISRVLAFLDTYHNAQDMEDEISQAVAATVQEEEKDRDTFNKLIEVNRWRWNRRDTLLEIELARREGLTLANHVAARIHQIEGSLGEAERIYRETVGKGFTAPEVVYGLAQTVLWQKKADEWGTLANEEEAKLTGYAPYWENLRSIPLLDPPQQAGTDFFPNLQEKAQAALDELKRIEEESSASSRQIRESLDAFHAVLKNRMTRTFYRFEESTFLLRDELGGFYFTAGDLDSAIRQYRRVLAIDPWDVSAIYQLGQVYELRGNWFQALQNYKRVFFADPLYENVTRLYNELAGDHADSLSFSASTLADGSRISYRGDAAFLTPINSLLGLSFRYRSDAVRIYIPFEATQDPSSYLIQSFNIGIPLDFSTFGLSIEPVIGAYLANDLYGDDRVAALAGSPSALQFLGDAGVEPFARIDAALKLGSFVTFEGDYYIGRELETFDPEKQPLPKQTIEATLNTSLGFVRTYPFRDSSLRTYGKVELLGDGNVILSGAQEISLGLLRLKKPSTALSLPLYIIFEHSQLPEDSNYFAPRGVLVLGGGLTASTWLDTGEESAVGLSLRANAASFQEEILSPADTVSRIQMEFEGGLEFSKREAFFSLAAVFNTTYRYAPPPPSGNPWDFWSLFVRLGYSTSLPRYLAP